MLGAVLAQVINGLVLGFLYIVIAEGLSIIFGIIGVVNFAHGAFVTVAAYIGWSVARAGPGDSHVGGQRQVQSRADCRAVDRCDGGQRAATHGHESVVEPLQPGFCPYAARIAQRAQVGAGAKRFARPGDDHGMHVGIGLGLLLESRQIRKMISSYVGENKIFAAQYLAGELELEFNPQGTLAERIRAGGAGIPAFFTRAGVGTIVAEGKEIRDFDGETFVMETGLTADVALVHAWKGDREGNLVYRKTARNFNPPMATAAKLTIAEVERLVEAGELDPDAIATPGVYVKRIVAVPDAPKRIEQRTLRKRDAA